MVQWLNPPRPPGIFCDRSSNRCSGGATGEFPPNTGQVRNSTLTILLKGPRRLEEMALLERLEMMQIKTVEPLADLEQENAEDKHCDQDIQRNPELDDHRHAVGGAHDPEERAVLHREKADTCGVGVGASPAVALAKAQQRLTQHWRARIAGRGQ